jgi:hypothetical protein
VTLLEKLIARAGLDGASLRGRTYRCSEAGAQLVPVNSIARHGRTWLEEWRIQNILAGIAENVPLPALRAPRMGDVYVLEDGGCRLECSIALGAEFVPVTRRP